MKSALEIYRKSLALIGEKEGGENLPFKERAVALINVILSQLYDLDLALRGQIPEEGEGIPQIHSLEEELALTEPVLCTLMPLALAGYLLYEEEPARGSFFLQLYHTERQILSDRARRGRRHKIKREG